MISAIIQAHFHSNLAKYNGVKKETTKNLRFA